MAFNSFQYLLFFSIIFFIYYFSNEQYRWKVLLAASIFFYLAFGFPLLLIALVLVTVISYVIGLKLAAVSTDKKKQYLLFTGIVLNLLVMMCFKYFPQQVLNFFTGQIKNRLCQDLLLSPNLESIGISFYTFQAISYLIEVYLELVEPEKHFGYFSLSLSFFPKISQGPIERSADLLPQLHSPYSFDYSNTRDSLVRIIKGLFIKMVLAERLAFFVNAVFNSVQDYSGPQLVLAIYLYSMQIYLDFFAYTEIALGSAGLFGIELAPNFNHPYLSTSVTEFWRRWHLSFSKWISDYLFKPLQMSLRRLKKWGTIIALLITFLISGIWHGATWGFLIWGLLQGLYLSLEVLVLPIENRFIKKHNLKNNFLFKSLKIFVTFNLVSFAWIFFRANNISDSLYIVSNLFSGWSEYFTVAFQYQNYLKALIGPLMLGQKTYDAKILLVVFAIYIAYHMIKEHSAIRKFTRKWNVVVQWLGYYALVIGLLLFGVFGQSQFIYFQF